MIRRVAVLMGVIVGITSLAFAQGSPSVLPEAHSQRESSSHSRVIVETRWLALNDNCIERFGEPGLTKVPALGSHEVYDLQTIARLVHAASSDRRASAQPATTIAMQSGERHELSPFRESDEFQGNGVVQAILSNDQQTIQIDLRWGKRKHGEEGLPAVTASFPVGGNLLVHTHDVLSPPLPGSIGRERHAVFLLVTARIASQEQGADSERKEASIHANMGSATQPRHPCCGRLARSSGRRPRVK